MCSKIISVFVDAIEFFQILIRKFLSRLKNKDFERSIPLIVVLFIFLSNTACSNVARSNASSLDETESLDAIGFKLTNMIITPVGSLNNIFYLEFLDYSQNKMVDHITLSLGGGKESVFQIISEDEQGLYFIIDNKIYEFNDLNLFMMEQDIPLTVNVIQTKDITDIFVCKSVKSTKNNIFTLHHILVTNGEVSKIENFNEDDFDFTNTSLKGKVLDNFLSFEIPEYKKTFKIPITEKINNRLYVEFLLNTSNYNPDNPQIGFFNAKEISFHDSMISTVRDLAVNAFGVGVNVYTDYEFKDGNIYFLDMRIK